MSKYKTDLQKDVCVGQQLKQTRKKLNLTQSDLARLTGIRQSIVADHENGYGLTVGVLLRYCAAMGCELQISFIPDKQ